MKVYHGFDSLPTFEHPVVTVGSYDGVHRGHRALIGRLVAEARAVGGTSIVLTFDPHPRIALGRGEGLRLLTSLDEKIALLAASGVDCVIVIPFDRTFAALSGREFVERYLMGKIGAETLVAGYNHRFGHDRLDPATLPAAMPLRIVRIERHDVDGTRVSSTAIRHLLDAGDTAEAVRLLGHPVASAAPDPCATAERHPDAPDGSGTSRRRTARPEAF